LAQLAEAEATDENGVRSRYVTMGSSPVSTSANGGG